MKEDIIVKVVEATSKEFFEKELNELVVLYNNMNYNIDIKYMPCRTSTGSVSFSFNTWYSALIIARRNQDA